MGNNCEAYVTSRMTLVSLSGPVLTDHFIIMADAADQAAVAEAAALALLVPAAASAMIMK
jgi:hypothetical protein